MWKILTQCPNGPPPPPPLMVERYCAQVCAVSSARIPNFLASQTSRRRSIFRQIAPELVTCWARWRITVWRKMNLYAFQRCFQTPVSSTARVYTKRRLTLLLGAS